MALRKSDEAAVYVAIESGCADIDGETHNFTRGTTRLRAGHPLLAAIPQHFQLISDERKFDQLPVYVAITSGAVDVKGVVLTFERGVTRVRTGDPLLKAVPQYFEQVENDVWYDGQGGRHTLDDPEVQYQPGRGGRPAQRMP